MNPWILVFGAGILAVIFRDKIGLEDLLCKIGIPRKGGSPCERPDQGAVSPDPFHPSPLPPSPSPTPPHHGDATTPEDRTPVNPQPTPPTWNWVEMRGAAPALYTVTINSRPYRIFRPLDAINRPLWISNSLPQTQAIDVLRRTLDLGRDLTLKTSDGDIAVWWVARPDAASQNMLAMFQYLDSVRSGSQVLPGLLTLLAAEGNEYARIKVSEFLAGWIAQAENGYAAFKRYPFAWGQAGRVIPESIGPWRAAATWAYVMARLGWLIGDKESTPWAIRNRFDNLMQEYFRMPGEYVRNTFAYILYSAMSPNMVSGVMTP